MNKKVSIIGAGNVGTACGQRIWQRDIADVVLLDIMPDMPKGKAVDMMHSSYMIKSNARIIGTNSYEETADSDVVIMLLRGTPPPNATLKDGTQLSGRASGIVNSSEVLKESVEKSLQYSPNCIFIVVTNPVDVMSLLVHRTSKLPKNRVMGMAGVLDTARLRYMISCELNVSVEDVSACIIGEHGASMVPIPRLTTVGCVPITDVLPQAKIDELVKRAKGAASEVFKYTKPVTPYIAPAMATALMTEAILLDQKKVLPVSTYLEGEYGIDGIFLGVPAIIGAGGVERILEINLNNDEKALLKKAEESVRELVGYLDLI